MSKGQTKKTREAAGNRRKLTRAEKKQIAAVIRQAKGDGKAHTAQQTIPYLAMYPDGICKVAQRKYSKSIAFEDINYQLAQADDKTAIFENWCDFLNYFDASVNVQLPTRPRTATLWQRNRAMLQWKTNCKVRLTISKPPTAAMMNTAMTLTLSGITPTN